MAFLSLHSSIWPRNEFSLYDQHWHYLIQSSASGANEGEKSGTKRVTRSKGQGGNQSGDTSSENSIPGSVSATVASQCERDLAGRAANNVISLSTTALCHTTSSSNPN